MKSQEYTHSNIPIRIDLRNFQKLIYKNVASASMRTESSPFHPGNEKVKINQKDPVNPV